MAHSAVTVSLEALKNGTCMVMWLWETLPPVDEEMKLISYWGLGTVPFTTLEAAFGPESLGIILVKDVDPAFVELRQRLLSYSTYLGNLPPQILGKVQVHIIAYNQN